MSNSYAVINPSGVVVNVIAKSPAVNMPVPDGWKLEEITGLPVGIGCVFESGEFIFPEDVGVI